MTRGYDNSVFINCPFDEGYGEIMQAIIFTVYSCGFIPRSALEEENGLSNRLSKIENIIDECKFGIHDISRIENGKNMLPRFNMPFELGIFFGAKRYGNKKQKSKVALILEREKYLYQQYISDLSGIDTKAHYNDYKTAIKIVRDWIKANARVDSVDGHLTIIRNFTAFREYILPLAISRTGLELRDLSFNDFCVIVESSMKPYKD